MKGTLQLTFTKLLYGFLFVVCVPALLVLWARATETVVHLPIIASDQLGIALTVIGLLFMGLGFHGLIVFGEGLPMNAFPPRLYVRQGVYRLIPHPIYLGFSLCCFGTAILSQSSSGTWLVAPIATLGCVALVEGFEKQDLIERFGTQIRRCIISLPANEVQKPLLRERLSVYVMVLLPWLVAYEAFVALGIPADAVVAFFAFEYNLPIVEWTEIIYGGTYLFVLLVPFVAATSRTLREFAIAGLCAIGAMALLFVSVPLIAPPREFAPEGFFGRLLLTERNFDTPAAAFPSYHVVWAVISARAYAQSFPDKRWLWWTLAFLIAVSCVTTGMHAIIDVVAGVVAGFLFLRYKQVWEWFRSASESVANSWKEWYVGSVRIINHGAYTGLGAAVGVWIVGTILGTDSIWYVMLIALLSLIMAGLWAQIIEGSSALLRPYGYYGGVIGIFLGAFVAHLNGQNAWMLLGGYALAGPVIQALGRLRCLVQGCCHGREALPHVGIRHSHPRSRVCRLTPFAGIPIHPTALYSILWNAVVWILLTRLWTLQADAALLAGMYLILNGIGRFVEEAYRGEPQTPILGKLRLYQLMAILSVIGGATMTTMKAGSLPSGLHLNVQTLVLSMAFGLITWFAQGVDFPSSNRRFSRLV